MAVIIQLINRPFGPPSPADGQYVVRYDPRLDRDEVYLLETTPDPAKAKQFSSGFTAMQYARQVCPNKPTESDGRPNRPLTAFTMTFERAP